MSFKIKLISSMESDRPVDYFYAERLFRHRGLQNGRIKVFYEGFFMVFYKECSGGNFEITIRHIYHPHEMIYHPPRYPSSKGIDWTLKGDYQLRQFLEKKEASCYFIKNLQDRAVDFAERTKQKPLAIFVTWIKEPWKTRRVGLLGWMKIDDYIMDFPKGKRVDSTRYYLTISEWESGDNKMLLSKAIEYLREHSYYTPRPAPPEHESSKYPGLMCYW